MKQQSKFSTNQQREQAAESQTAHQAAREFESVEQLLRHDVGQVTVPPVIARRLSESLKEPETPHRPWWRRLLD